MTAVSRTYQRRMGQDTFPKEEEVVTRKTTIRFSLIWPSENPIIMGLKK
jgi:hypothetical protein